jgi:hypothetical protein
VIFKIGAGTRMVRTKECEKKIDVRTMFRALYVLVDQNLGDSLVA